MSARTLDSDLARARAAFDAWRSGGRGPGRIPDHLWQMAIALLDDYELATVAHALGLNPGRLRARLAKQRPATSRRSPKPAFVELRALDLVPAPEPQPDTPVPASGHAGPIVRARIERPDGARLTLFLPAGCGLLDEVCAAFLRA
jgi:hypothetical protein